jgi:hypothetical protein
VDKHHPAAADPAHVRVDHTLDEGDGDRRVDGVATPPHDFEADLGCLGLGADDDRHKRKLDQRLNSARSYLKA